MSGAGHGGAGVTRRSFLDFLGRSGSASAMYAAMRALDLIPDAGARAGRFDLEGRAPGTRVLVLGAGLAGLAAAYELQKAGYVCEVVDARVRPGGRCFTVRGGTRSEESGVDQTCRFDDGLYLNAGPARIPHHHTTTLNYCRELGVALEVFCNANEAAYLYQSAGPSPKRARLREVRADWDGYTAELLAKATSQQELDQTLTRDDQEKLLSHLRRAGGLNDALRYTGSGRRGYRKAPGAGVAEGELEAPTPLADLLQSGLCAYLSTEFALQAPLFQVVGGTDNLARAFAARVKNISLGQEVTTIEHDETRVRVHVRDRQQQTRVLEAAFAICALPLTALRQIRFDVPPAIREAIDTVPYSSAGKIGLQFKRRFWEEDDGIYGGISRTDLPITQILYPSCNYLGSKGIVIGYYHNGESAARMGALSPTERLKAALDQGSRIHPQYATEFERAFSVAWQNVPYSYGGWAQWRAEHRQQLYHQLLRPVGRLYFAGDHLSYLSGWMAGAFESARAAASAIHERAMRDQSEVVRRG